jgi:hypothetical protein
MRTATLTSLLLITASAASAAQPAPAASALVRMPVREVTVFKDGHAFVLHQGEMPTDASGNVVMDYLPHPVLGTFWPYSAEPGARLQAVTAGQRRLKVERTALHLRELLEANEGAQVQITEVNGTKYDATILDFPKRSSEELEATSPPNSGEMLPQKGDLVLLKTAQGTKALPIARIQDVTFKHGVRPRVSDEEFRALLNLKLDWQGKKPDRNARVGMVYLQKGIRWIPSYRIALDGQGQASVKLQATLVNELTDLQDVTLNLVVGVPSFAFEGTPDPIGLQQTVAQLSPYFDRTSQMGQMMSNAIMSQTEGRGRGGFRQPEPAPNVDLGPEVGGSEKAEDLFVFNVQHVTLRKGQRLALPVAEYSLKYRDLFTLELPYGPPASVQGNVSTEQQAELARLLARPRFMHKVRIVNSGPHPITTAPALVVRGERILAQGMTTFTPSGADLDLPITAAVDIRVRKEERETKRTPNAETYQGYQLARVEFSGALHIQNHRGAPVDVEIARYVLGQVDTVGQDGKTEMLNPLEDEAALALARPQWWSNYNWPVWWGRFNGIGRFSWKKTLGAGETLDLDYAWHQFIQ